MPNYENNNLQGTLFITFDVEFPKQELSTEDKEGLYSVYVSVKLSLLNLFYSY